jgi:hypothetical protein
MPVMDGYEASIRIRENEAAREIRAIPIVAMTGNIPLSLLALSSPSFFYFNFIIILMFFKIPFFRLNLISNFVK